MSDVAKVAFPSRYRLAVSLIALLPLCFSSAQAQSSFKSRQDFRVGDHPSSLVVGDYDGDGVADLITVDLVSGYISLTRGFGEGSFRRVKTVVAGSAPRATRLVDVNHDGLLDLVTTNRLSVDVTVNLGDGHGGFDTRIRTATPAPGYYIGVGDWDRDGNLDVALLDTIGGTMITMRGTGTGTFSNAVSYTVGSAPSWIEVADFNADGISDLAVVNSGSDNVQIWRGNGTGGFTLNATLSTGTTSGVTMAAARDVNGDGRPDLVVCLQALNSVTVYLANGAGGFNAPSTLSPGLGPESVAIDDVNQDGFMDLLIGMSLVSGVGQVAIMTGNGAGSFSAPVVHSTGPDPAFIATGDFNGDGNPDVVTASRTGNALSVLRTLSPGTFLAAGRVNVKSGAYPIGVVVGDFNLDGHMDIAAADEGSDDIVTVFGNGDGTFRTPTYTNTGTGSSPQSLVVLDTNHDNAPDIVGVMNANTMTVLQNSGSGNFNPANGLALSTCDGADWIATGEINGDLNPDVVFSCEVSNQVCTRRGTGGTGANAFGATVCNYLDPSPEGVSTGFFNFDSFQDIAASSQTSNWVDIVPSDGFGGFQDLPSSFSTSGCPRGLKTADLNGDGYDDLVVAGSCSSTVSTLLGDGGGVFSVPSIDTVVGQGPTFVAVADFNLDGKLDIVSTNANSNDVSLLLGDKLGNFTKAGDFGTRDYPLGVAVADFNEDGKPDLVVADNFNDSLTILLNQTVLGANPMQSATVGGQVATVLQWGLVPGAVYDVIRGQVGLLALGGTTNSLGPVTCLANDLPDHDTSALPDVTMPAVGQGFFYAIREVVGGVPGSYMVSNSGKQAVPSSGGCP